MALKQCAKCSEMVDEAKAFCPGCGNAFVEEETREASDFEKMDSTVQLGNTMYNQMLSDMGLNISKSAPPPEKRIEVIKPAVSASSLKVPVQKAAPAQTLPPPKQGISSTTKWLILAGFILIVGVLILLATVVLLYMFWPRMA